VPAWCDLEVDGGTMQGNAEVTFTLEDPESTFPGAPY
jgi:hypothetical protein